MNQYEKDICVRCVKKVLDTDEGIQCDGVCCRWFHRSCVGVPKSEYNKLAANTQNKWYCLRVDCSSKSPILDLMDVLNSLVAKVDTLSAKVDKLDEVPEDTKVIKAEVRSIQDKLSVIEPRVESLDQRVSAIENASKGVEPKIDNLIGEVNERNLRKKNIIIYNAPESVSTNLDTVKSYDNGLVTSIVSSADNTLDTGKVKFFRLGPKKAGRIRPIKVIFTSEEIKLSVINKFDSKSASSVNPLLKDVKLSWDRTPLELEALDRLRSELDSRTANGEKDLTIKYKNGVPTIITTKRNSKN